MSQTSYGRFPSHHTNSQSQLNSSSNNTLKTSSKIFAVNNFVSTDVSSVRPDCLDNLRFSKNKKNVRTHLLAFMSEYIEEKNEIPVEQVDQLCCYDRMKKLLKKDQEQGSPNQYQNKLTKAIHIQAKLNNMEKNLTKFNQERQKKYEKYEKIRKGKSYHNIPQRAMIDQVKERSLNKFINYYKSNKQANLEQFKAQVQKQIENTVYKILEQRDSGYIRLLKEKEELDRKILQKQLQIEQTKIEVGFLKQQLIIQKDSEQQIKQKNSELKKAQSLQEQWYNQFKENFPQMSVNELKRTVQSLQDRCLRQLKYLDQKNQRERKDDKKMFESSIGRLKDQIKNAQLRETDNIKKLRILQQNKQLSSLQIDKLITSSKKLDHLQSLIFALYNKWYGQRNQTEKSMLKKLGYLKQDYDYQQMVHYIVEYKQKFSTDFKLNEYIIKILRGIHKLKKIVDPKTANQKLDPFSTLQHLEKWVKFKINQQAIKGGSNNQRVSLKKQQEDYFND